MSSEDDRKKLAEIAHRLYPYLFSGQKLEVDSETLGERLERVRAGLLPETLRLQYGLRWGRGRRRMFQVAVSMVPRVISLTPPLLRVWPLPGRTVSLR